MPKYQVEMETGDQYELELDEALPDTPESQDVLQQLVHEQLRQPSTTGPSVWESAGRLGGMAVQGAGKGVLGMLGAPADLANLASRGVKAGAHAVGIELPEPRKIPGGSADLEQFVTEKIPDAIGMARPMTAQTTAERLTEDVGRAAAGVFPFLRIPGVKQRMSQLLYDPHAVRPTPLLYEEGTVAGRGATGIKPTPTLAKPAGVLLTELSKPAQNLAEVLQIPTSTAGILRLSQVDSQAALTRLLNTLGTNYALVRQEGPARDLFEMLEAQVLRFR
jgi:hypothetical protein